MHAMVCAMKAFTIMLPAAAACLIFATPASAQTPQQPGGQNDNVTDAASRNPFWQASLGGGHYMVRLDRISSISRHRYLLDGAVIVDEVTVDTNGQALARFYHLAPVTNAVGNESVTRIADRGREIIEQAAGRANTDVHNMVVKKYPDTTHARTIEYRVETTEQLTALYDSLRTAWQSGRGREMTIQR